LYWRDFGNKDLKPERSISFDAGLYYKFTALARNEFEFTYYNINTADRIVWTPVSGNIWRPVNIGKVKSEGIDLSLKSAISFGERIQADLNVNYSFGEAVKKNIDFPGDPSYNKQLIYLPKEMLKSGFMFYYLPTRSILKYLSFSLFYKFASKRYVNFENTLFSPEFDVFDANAGIVVTIFGLDLNFKFIINNVFNEEYQAVPGYPMPLRNYKFEIGLKY
jgi:iron complex outermembrane receptor protein